MFDLGLLFTKYMREPINYLYTDGSPKLELETKDFIFATIGVVMGFQSII